MEKLEPFVAGGALSLTILAVVAVLPFIIAFYLFYWRWKRRNSKLYSENEN